MAQITNINASPLVSHDKALFVTLKDGKFSRCDMKGVIDELKAVINQLDAKINEKDVMIDELNKKIEKLNNDIKDVKDAWDAAIVETAAALVAPEVAPVVEEAPKAKGKKSKKSAE